MTANWVKIFSTTDAVKLETVLALLADADIETFVFERADTAYPWLGEMEIHCLAESVIQAKQLIKRISR